MENEEKVTLTVVATVVAVPIVMGAFQFINTVRVERAKRKKIRLWEQMNLEAITASTERWKKLASDPNVTASQLWAALREESQFMKLIHDQPMY